MTDLREIVDVRGPGQPSEFVCAATVGQRSCSAASGQPEGEILRKAARSRGVRARHGGNPCRAPPPASDHAVFPLGGGTLARARLDRGPSPSVAVRLA